MAGSHRQGASRRKATVSIDSYRDDALYPRIVRAVEALLTKGTVVTPVDVLLQMRVLDPRRLEDWRFGRVPYLEAVVQGSLSRLSRLLRILRFHAHDLNLVPSLTAYMRWGKGRKQRLRFTKTGDKRIEEAYSRHFLWRGKEPFRVSESAGASRRDASAAAVRVEQPSRRVDDMRRESETNARRASKSPRISKERVAEMIEEATVDAHDEAEQAIGWFTIFEEHLDLPFETKVLGTTVTVTSIHLRDNNQLVAICTRGRNRQAISLEDLQLRSPKPAGSEWIEAYRHWLAKR